MSRDDDTDETDTFDVIDLTDYRMKKLREEDSDEWHQEQFDLGLYMAKLAEEEREYQRKQKARQMKDLIMLFYCLSLTLLLMYMLLNN